MLYEDEGNNYNYENGAYTEIPMTWNDAKRTLTIDARRGCYEGMLDERKFTVRMPDGSEKGSPDKPGGLSIQLCKSEKKEFYIRYSS